MVNETRAHTFYVTMAQHPLVGQVFPIIET
jgi:truncated hemoglobin YjbI